MKTALKVLGGLLALVIVVVGGALAWAFSTANGKLATKHQVPAKDVQIPWPLTQAEVDVLIDERLATRPPPPPDAPPIDRSSVDPYGGEDPKVFARARAAERGKRLVETRLGCMDCHGTDFGGKTIIDAPPMGKWISPNITTGGVTKDYTSLDWVRLIRHGVKPSGLPAIMPAQDYAMLSDKEVSDVVAFVTTRPPVTTVQPKSEVGPVFAMLMATGQFPLAAEVIDHAAPRPELPPAEEVSATFGKHLAQSCIGCHGEGLSGGPIPGGDPSWPPAGNLTPDATGLKAWTGADFRKALREGKRPDGSSINEAMPWKMFGHMSDTEIDALFTYLQSVPAKAKGGR